MDLINNRTKDITAMAMDGLYERSKAISSNTANALTPNYQRKEVNFEASLREIIRREDEKEDIRAKNVVEYQKNPAAFLNSRTPAELAFMSTNIGEGFSIDIDVDNSDPVDSDGNNVSLEVEMMDEAKTGMQYQVLSNLLAKQYQALANVIKGQNS